MSPIPIIKVCLTCRHLEVVEEGQAVEGLAETAYVRYRCRKYGGETTEYPQFPEESVGRIEIDGERPKECPGWEQWMP